MNTHNKKLIEKTKKIKIVLTDVDGVLTDGGMYYSEKGEVLKKFNTKDGMGVELLLKNGIKTIFITKENSEIVKKRASKVRAAVYTNVSNKEKLLEKICKKFSINLEQVAYIGDDINDLEVMKRVGVSCTPFDGNIKLKEICDLICTQKGGNGCFREFADFILFLKC